VILANDFKRQWEEIREDVLSSVSSVGESGWYILGSEVEVFEKSLGAFWGIEQVVGVASGLDAIEISLRALGCEPGAKVLTTPISAFATTLAIAKLGAVPVFCDVDRYGLIDLHACADVLKQDPSIRFFVPVHLYGHALDLPRLCALQNEFDLAIVEDCAQAIGARYEKRPVGTVGEAAAVSFYPTKNLGALGDGGAIASNDVELRRNARMLRDYGQSAKYQHEVIGYNSRLDELHASILARAMLPRLSGWMERRREIAATYMAEIANPRVSVPGFPAGSESSWHLFPVLVDPAAKNEFLNYLKVSGVQGSEHYPAAIPDQPAMRSVEYEVCPSGIENARQFCRSQVSLPIHPYLTDGEVQGVIATVNRWT
jgi:dTDP-3-amino-3,4,6-trideoxy-alpha-D-glucose transaminase